MIAYASDYSNIVAEESYIWEISLSVLFSLSILGFILAFIFKDHGKKFIYSSCFFLFISLAAAAAWQFSKAQAVNDQIELLNKNASISVSSFEEEGRKHIKEDEAVMYKNNPPTSGNHLPVTAEYGFYKKEMDERKLVHNLEHGDIVIYYRPDLSSEQRDELKYLSRFVKRKGVFGSGVIAVPKEDMKYEIIATAWNHSMSLEEFNGHKVSQFIYDYIQEGPEDVPMMN